MKNTEIIFKAYQNAILGKLDILEQIAIYRFLENDDDFREFEITNFESESQQKCKISFRKQIFNNKHFILIRVIPKNPKYTAMQEAEQYDQETRIPIKIKKIIKYIKLVLKDE